VAEAGNIAEGDVYGRIEGGGEGGSEHYETGARGGGLEGVASIVSESGHSGEDWEGSETQRCVFVCVCVCVCVYVFRVHVYVYVFCMHLYVYVHVCVCGHVVVCVIILNRALMAHGEPRNLAKIIHFTWLASLYGTSILPSRISMA
jgi:hypothetical protein